MQPQPHIPPATANAAISAALKSQRARKNRGSYSCGRCGQPKKGHVCHLPPLDFPSTPVAPEPVTSVAAAASSTRSTVVSLSSAPLRQPFNNLRRVLSFDDDVDAHDEPDPTDLTDLNLDSEIVQPGRFHAVALWEVLKRLPPPGLMMAARVCRGWRETARKMWRAAEELRIRVPKRAQIGYDPNLKATLSNTCNISSKEHVV